MTPQEVIFFVALSGAGLCLSALFSGIETGLYTINRVRLRVRAGRGLARATRLLGEMRSVNRALITLLIANNIANYAGSYGVAALLDGAGFSPAQTIALNAAILIPLLFVFGETLPKDLFRTHTDAWSYSLTPLLTWTRRLLTLVGLVPIVQIFGAIVGRAMGAGTASRAPRERVARLLKEGVDTGLISESQTTLADRALAMRDTTVRSAMVPWRQVIRIMRDDPREVCIALLRYHYTRLPVVDRTGRVIGVMSILDAVLDPERSIADLTTETIALDPNIPVFQALRQMRDERKAMAIVTNAAGLPLGLVTLKDLVEPLTGDLAGW